MVSNKDADVQCSLKDTRMNIVCYQTWHVLLGEGM